VIIKANTQKHLHY